MKWKLNVFTVFIILLIILVLFIMINKQFTIRETKETFVDFYKDNATNSLTILNIPQYSSDSKRLVVHLYDNLYFDDKNGAVIEVDSTQTTSAQDTTGSTITRIHIYPRNGGLSDQSYSNTDIKDGKVVGYDTHESKITTLTPAYDDYSKIGNVYINDQTSDPAHMYQYFYYTWNKQTFIHLFKFNIKVQVKVKAKQLIFLRSFIFGESGLKSVFEDTANSISKAVPAVTDTGTPSDRYKSDKNKTLVSSPAPPAGTSTTTTNSYLDNKIKVFQITPYVFYDTDRGIIIINTPANKSTIPKLTYYDNAGNNIASPVSISKPIEITPGTYKIFAKSSPSGMVLVTSYTYNTIISVISYTDGSNKIVATQRFNNKEKKQVNDLATDPEYLSATSPPPTTAPTTTPPGGWNEWNKKFNNKWNELYDGKMNCGSDKSCWYWFFKSLPNDKDRNDISNMYDSNNGQSFFSDDYFLKTEAVPPVCPQCPNCPTSGTGTCTSCGGHGGSGTTLSSCSPVDLHLTPIVSTKYTDNLGNIYIATTDNSGNKSYKLEGKISDAATTTTTPNSVGTGLSPLNNNISGLANNVVNTAGGAVGTAGNLALSAGSGAVNLLKDTGSGAVDLLKDTGSGAVDLLKDTGSGAIGLLKDAGSGIANLGSGGLQTQGSQYNSAGGAVGAGGVGPSQLGSVSDKTFGKMSGQTPVDNYSYYGALQSKGGNFMPVTADFSSFRK